MSALPPLRAHPPRLLQSLAGRALRRTPTRRGRDGGPNKGAHSRGRQGASAHPQGSGAQTSAKCGAGGGSPSSLIGRILCVS